VDLGVDPNRCKVFTASDRRSAKTEAMRDASNETSGPKRLAIGTNWYRGGNHAKLSHRPPGASSSQSKLASPSLRDYAERIGFGRQRNWFPFVVVYFDNSHACRNKLLNHAHRIDSKSVKFDWPKAQ
jgi:hypothetical protein